MDIFSKLFGSEDEKQQLIDERDAVRNQFEDGQMSGDDAIPKLRALNIQIADDTGYCRRCRLHHSGPQC